MSLHRPPGRLPSDEPLHARLEAVQAELERRRQDPPSGRVVRDDDAELRREQILVLEEKLRQALEALDASRAIAEREATRFRSLFDLAPDPLFVTDLRGLLADGNAAAADLVDVPPGGWAGVPLVTFLHPGDAATFEGALAATGRGPCRVRMRFRGRNGRSMRGSVRVAPTGHDGQVLWTVRLERGGGRTDGPAAPTAAEIERRLGERVAQLEAELATSERRIEAERRVREDAQSLATMQRRVMALVAQEATHLAEHTLAWAQPLAVLAEGATAEGLRAIAWTARLELEIARDLLDVSRLATQQLRSEFVPVEIADVAQQAVTVVAPRAEMAQVELRQALAARAIIPGEPTRVGQLVVGLLGLAIEHAGAGGHVAVRTEVTADHVAVVVSRTGPAHGRDDVDWTLDRLDDADLVASFAAHHVGMKLFIVRHLAALHGGRLTVVSEGDETVLAVAIPRPRSAVAAPPSSRRGW